MKNSQYKDVMNHLKTYGTITSLEAFNLYGITRLSGIIFRLKKEGNDIETQMKVSKNRYGNICNYAEYHLKQ